jgi:Sec-independent protein translocase protein TatA
MLEIGLREIIVVGGGAMLVLGKEEMPLVARTLGQGLGRIVGFMQGAKMHLSRLASSDDTLMQLHREIQDNMQDLQNIKAELRTAGAVNALRQGAFTAQTQSHPGSVGHIGKKRREGLSHGFDTSSMLGQRAAVTAAAPSNLRLAGLALAEMQVTLPL